MVGRKNITAVIFRHTQEENQNCCMLTTTLLPRRMCRGKNSRHCPPCLPYPFSPFSNIKRHLPSMTVRFKCAPYMFVYHQIIVLADSGGLHLNKYKLEQIQLTVLHYVFILYVLCCDPNLFTRYNT